MKTIVSLIIILVSTIQLTAQEVANVRAFQEEGKAVIMYDLLSVDPNKEFFVKIFSSTDGGKNFGSMLMKISGDANSLVKAGMNKTAIWDVLQESSSAKGEFVFRVDAVSIGPKGVLPGIEEQGVAFQIVDVTRSNNDVSLAISLTNKTGIANNLILGNFLVVDDGDRICRDISGDINKLQVLAANERRMVTIVVRNVNPDAKSFTQFDFRASAIAVKFKKIPFLTN